MNSFVSILQWLCRFNFGNFEKEEFKKFLRLGLIFGLIIGVYWTLRPLKDAIFIQLVDKMHLPFAKTFSVLALIPLVMVYTRLIDKFSKERMLILLPLFYGVMIFGFSLLMLCLQMPQEQFLSQSLTFKVFARITGYFWYLFVESFGSLVVALFWAFSTNITNPNAAKKGFPLIVALGQLGGVILPYNIGGLPHRMQLSTDALSLFILSLLVFALIPLVRHFFKATPKELFDSFGLEKKENAIEEKLEPGFLEGLKLVAKHRYLLGLFFVNFIYEFIVTLFDFNFKIAAANTFSGVALSNYLSLYGSSVNLISLLCLLFGISNITRFLGVGAALGLMPMIVGLALFGFLTIDSLNFLFMLMVGSKAINYALNGPALKQLYIPTTSQVRFQAGAWIETFGSRASKEAGSLFNILLTPLQANFGQALGKSYYLILSGYLGFPLLLIWAFLALFLGRSFKHAVQSKQVIC